MRQAIWLLLILSGSAWLSAAFGAEPADLKKAADDVKSIIDQQLRGTAVDIAFLPAVREPRKNALYLYADYNARLIGAGLGAAQAIARQVSAEDLSELVFIWEDRTQVDIIPGEAIGAIVTARSNERLAELLNKYLIRHPDRSKLPVSVQVWLKNPQGS